MMEPQEELVLITINYKGKDIQVEVDIHTANILLNDEVQAKAFIEQMLNHNTNNSETEAGNSSEAYVRCRQVEIEAVPSTTYSSCSSDEIHIWSGRRSSAKDDEALVEFLKLRSKYDSLFNDKKKTAKMKIWHKIANELAAQGYSVGENGAEKCRQKFANLQKQYLSHIKHMKQTDEKKKSPPHFFDKLHSILGDKHKINRQNTQDSFIEDVEVEESQEHETMEKERKDVKKTTPTSIKNRSNQCRPKIDRPDSKTDKYMSFLKKEMEQDRETNKKQFKVFEKLMDVQNEQRERMLGMFGELIKQQKRKNRDESDSDD